VLVGILSGLAAGALWGLTFVAPRAIHPYSEVDLAIGRYLVFGLTALVLMAASVHFRPGRMTLGRVGLALWLGLSGFVIYYLCIAFAVSLAGPAIPPLVIGALPLLLAIYGNWWERTVRWRALAAPLALIGAGLAVVNTSALMAAEAPGAARDVALGLILAVAGLAVWFLYAITNARALRSADPPPMLGWTSLQGLGAAAGTLPLLLVAPVIGWSRVPELGLAGDAGLRLVVWALGLGIVASFVAQYLWTVASRRLPLALSAQMIVAETVFALVFGFALEGRWPQAAEWAGGALLIAGVVWGVKAFARKRGGDGGPAPSVL
jgi:drug/metabolite transporter (DMT)-like permease